ncbi:hypothetical protein [Streptomyces griseoluteus]|uniref:hypothetical protein n=1 Tax=Streptomyces griseoluteus TaxID=29306 RepID=UPI003F4CB4F0
MADTVRVLLPVLLVVITLLVVRRRMPVLFWWLVGYPVVALRVLISYRATMDACDLTVPASAVHRATARLMGRSTDGKRSPTARSRNCCASTSDLHRAVVAGQAP